MGKATQPRPASAETDAEADEARDRLHDLEMIEEQLPGRLSAENFTRLERRVSALERCIEHLGDVTSAWQNLSPRAKP
jgi:hypothetical protein